MNLNNHKMQISIENKNFRKSKPRNPIWAIVWRFILFCAIFDGGIYFYFHKVQNTTVTEGIKRIRFTLHGNEDQKFQNIQKYNVYIPQTSNKYSEEIEFNQKSMSENSKITKQNLDQYSPKISSDKTERVNKIYCWEDENGNKHFSNSGYPSNGYFKVVKFE